MIYSIVINPTQPIDTDRLHYIITTAIMVTDWWHYLPNMYLVNTTLNAAQMTSTLQTQFPGLLFIVNKIDPTEYNGVLPKDAWDWIQKYNNSTKKLVNVLKVTDTSYTKPLSSLFNPPLKVSLGSSILEDILKTPKK